MSYENSLTCISMPAAGDLSTKQYKVVAVNSDGRVAVAGAGVFGIGILQDKPAALGRACTVAVAGVSMAMAGDTVAAGARVTADANGDLVTATPAKVDTSDSGAASDPVIASNVIGIALKGAADGDIFPVLLLHAGAVPTTAA